MTQAIVTRYIGPTDYRGSRIKATCDAGSVTIPYPYEANPGEDAHRVAADTLMARLLWDEHSDLVGGGLPDKHRDAYVFVLVPKGQGRR